jgi:hypothetical protein
VNWPQISQITQITQIKDRLIVVPAEVLSSGEALSLYKPTGFCTAIHCMTSQQQIIFCS